MASVGAVQMQNRPECKNSKPGNTTGIVATRNRKRDAECVALFSSFFEANRGSVAPKAGAAGLFDPVGTALHQVAFGFYHFNAKVAQLPAEGVEVHFVFKCRALPTLGDVVGGLDGCASDAALEHERIVGDGLREGRRGEEEGCGERGERKE
jgi:hypothetical protein